jgi:hypothetical protein
MADPLRTALKKGDAWVKSDNAFQRRARLLQVLWREQAGLEAGERNGKINGARLRADDAAELANFLSPGAKTVADTELAESDPDNPDGRWNPERLIADLTSSQPMLCNLFGELALDPDFTGAALHRLWPDWVAEVVALELRRPGDTAPGFVDVLVDHVTPAGVPAMTGFRVRYAENFRVGPQPHDDAWNRIAKPPPGVDGPPLQQFWFDHLALIEAAHLGDQQLPTRLVHLHPAGNERAEKTAQEYVTTVAGSFDTTILTIENLVSALRAVEPMAWIDDFCARYLDFAAVDAAIGIVADSDPVEMPPGAFAPEDLDD